MSTNNKRIGDKNKEGDGYKIAVKRRKGVPKSDNKNLSYAKRYAGCEDTSLAKEIIKFEKRHRRMVCTDDVVKIFHSLQLEEPHAEQIIYTFDTQFKSNYYFSLFRHVYTYDEEPVELEKDVYYKHVRRVKKIVKHHNMTFEEIIEEHKFLLNEMEHKGVLACYEEPHSNVDIVEPTIVDDKVTDKDTSDNIGSKNPLWDDFDYNSQFDKVINELQPILIQVKAILPKCDKYIDVLEDLLFISYIIMYCDDSNVLLGTLLTIYKKHSKGSLSSQIYNFISRICFNRPKQEPHSGEFRHYANKFLQLHTSYKHYKDVK